jgi:hypothetical protein
MHDARHDARSVPEERVGHDRRWWAPGVDRALEDRALKRALERARGREARPASAWSVEELRSGLVVAPDGAIERLGAPGIPLGDVEVSEALARYSLLNRDLADRLRRAGLTQAELREGLAPALGYWQQLERLRRYHVEMVGAEEAGARC